MADLPEELTRLYGGGLGFPEPAFVVNFVESIDGVVAIPGLASSNALIAAHSEADKFLMGLLRACADVIVVGSGTLLGSPKGLWRPERVYRPAADAFADLRRRLGKPEHPAVAVVTGSGSIDPTHPVLEAGALVLTTEASSGELAARLPEAAEIVTVNPSGHVDLAAAVAALHERGHSLILSEGGPTLFASLLASGVADELFLTVSPVLAGRGTRPRLGLVEGLELLPDETCGSAELLSVRRHDEHLFLRYALG